MVDVHAEMWTACLEFADGLPLPAQFQTPEAKRLLNAGVKHVGGFVRFEGFKQRPRDASFARTEFLKFLRNHDPAYTRAIEQTVEEALSSPKVPAKARAARAP